MELSLSVGEVLVNHLALHGPGGGGCYSRHLYLSSPETCLPFPALPASFLKHLLLAVTKETGLL